MEIDAQAVIDILVEQHAATVRDLAVAKAVVRVLEQENAALRSALDQSRSAKE